MDDSYAEEVPAAHKMCKIMVLSGKEAILRTTSLLVSTAEIA